MSPTSHATYLQDRHMLALWTWNGHAPGRAPENVGEVETLALAVPGRDGLGVTDVECALVEPERLCTLAIENPGESIHLLRRALETDVEARHLPTAAHAVPNAAGTAVVSAGRALR
ncbi:DEAD/DEAH box helicase, partial [Nocardia sp. NPDC004722]